MYCDGHTAIVLFLTRILYFNKNSLFQRFFLMRNKSTFGDINTLFFVFLVPWEQAPYFNVKLSDVLNKRQFATTRPMEHGTNSKWSLRTRCARIN
mgnify:CR=1 FL=1